MDHPGYGGIFGEDTPEQAQAHAEQQARASKGSPAAIKAFYRWVDMWSALRVLSPEAQDQVRTEAQGLTPQGAAAVLRRALQKSTTRVDPAGIYAVESQATRDLAGQWMIFKNSGVNLPEWSTVEAKFTKSGSVPALIDGYNYLLQSIRGLPIRPPAPATDAPAGLVKKAPEQRGPPGPEARPMGWGQLGMTAGVGTAFGFTVMKLIQWGTAKVRDNGRTNWR